MYILDTDICIFWLKGNRNIELKIEEYGVTNIFVTIITACELYFGAYNSQRRNENIQILNDLFNIINIIQTTPEIARIFGENKIHLKAHGNIINDADILIASIVIANNGTLVTNNIAHFKRIPDLKMENWLS
jgi:tRNA(fMet)-specific endonuclease VapC